MEQQRSDRETFEQQERHTLDQGDEGQESMGAYENVDRPAQNSEQPASAPPPGEAVGDDTEITGDGSGEALPPIESEVVPPIETEPEVNLTGSGAPGGAVSGAAPEGDPSAPASEEEATAPEGSETPLPTARDVTGESSIPPPE